MKTYQNVGDKDIKLHIADTVFSLLEKKPIDELKVDEVRQKANVGRTTYYRYFGSKRGIRDALLYSLEAHFEEEQKKNPEKKTDDLFSSFLFDNKEKVLLLKKNNLMDILDDFVLFVYVPKEEKEEGVRLVRYIASGLWMGFIRALLENDFAKSKEEIQEEFRQGISALFLQANAQKEEENKKKS